jgi:hypothetical protein
VKPLRENGLAPPMALPASFPADPPPFGHQNTMTKPPAAMNAQSSVFSDEFLSARLDELLARASAGEAVFLHPVPLRLAA